MNLRRIPYRIALVTLLCSTLALVGDVAVADAAIPHSVSVNFAVGSSALNATAKSELSALAKKLSAGADVRFIGYAKSDPFLARLRAYAAADYVCDKVSANCTVSTNTTAAVNRATAITTAQ